MHLLFRVLVFRVLACTAVLGIGACDQSAPAPTNSTTAADSPASTPPAAAFVDDELEQLKTVTLVDACALLTTEKLASVFPGLTFEVHQELKPQMSGYLWDSRCTYWAGVGTYEYAKDAPTLTVELFAGTAVSETKAKNNLASRHELAKTSTGYQPQPALGDNAYATTNTGVAWLFFVKGQSEVQITFSDLDTPNEEKVAKAVSLSQSL